MIMTGSDRFKKIIKSKKTWLYGVVVLACVLVLIAALSGAGTAKYVSTFDYKENAYWSNQLALKFELLESKVRLKMATRDGREVVKDGTYEFVNDPDGSQPENRVPVLDQKYTVSLIPMTYIPKDPYVIVTGKTEIPSYLYVEVVESEDMKFLINGDPDDLVNDPKRLKYEMRNEWKLLTGDGTATGSPIAGPHGGKVYLYVGGGLGDSGGPITKYNFTQLDGKRLYLIKNDRLEVISKIPYERGTLDDEDFRLSAYGFLLQQEDGASALSVWSQFMATNPD